MADVTEDEIKNDIVKIIDGQQQLAELAANPQVKEFLQLQKKVEKTSDVLWGVVQEQMINAGVKSIKGDWGSVTVAERTSFAVDLDKLPRKYIKRAADLKKIGADYKLKGEAPEGATPKPTMYLLKKIKLNEEIA